MEVVTKSSNETYALGKKIGGNVKNLEKEDSSLIIGLKGQLGSGKTTFVQGLSNGLGITSSVPSPTFTIVRQYSINAGSYKEFHHIDLYRLNGDFREIKNLGLDDIFLESSNIVAIEWVDTNALQRQVSVTIEFEIMDENQRKIIINSDKSNVINTLLQ